MVKVILIPNERYPDLEMVRTDDWVAMAGYTADQAEEMPDDLYARFVAAKAEYDAVQNILYYWPHPVPSE